MYVINYESLFFEMCVDYVLVYKSRCCQQGGIEFTFVFEYPAMHDIRPKQVLIYVYIYIYIYILYICILYLHLAYSTSRVTYVSQCIVYWTTFVFVCVRQNFRWLRSFLLSAQCPAGRLRLVTSAPSVASPSTLTRRNLEREANGT